MKRTTVTATALIVAASMCVCVESLPGVPAAYPDIARGLRHVPSSAVRRRAPPRKPTTNTPAAQIRAAVPPNAPAPAVTPSFSFEDVNDEDEPPGPFSADTVPVSAKEAPNPSESHSTVASFETPEADGVDDTARRSRTPLFFRRHDQCSPPACDGTPTLPAEEENNAIHHATTSGVESGEDSCRFCSDQDGTEGFGDDSPHNFSFEDINDNLSDFPWIAEQKAEEAAALGSHDPLAHHDAGNTGPAADPIVAAQDVTVHPAANDTATLPAVGIANDTLADSAASLPAGGGGVGGSHPGVALVVAGYVAAMVAATWLVPMRPMAKRWR